MASPGFAEDEIALRILIATEQAVKNLELLNQKFDQTSAKAKKVKADVAEIGNVSNKAATGVNNMGNAASTANTKVGTLGKGLFSFTNVLRTALGTLEAMAIFLVSRFVGQALSKTFDSLKQLELAFYKLEIAERSLSKAGVEITPTDLTDISKEVQSTFDYISQIDSLKMVSNLALLTKDLKLTKEQLLDLAKAIPVLATSADITIESATDQIINGLTKSGKGWADLGITVDAAIIKQEAIKDGIVASADAYDKLTAEQKQQVEVLALIEILNRNVSDSLADQGDYLDTAAGKTRTLTGLWENFTTFLGTTFAPAIKLGLDILIALVQGLSYEVYYLQQIYVFWESSIVAGFTAIQGLLDGNIRSVKEFNALFIQAYKEASSILKNSVLYPELPTDTPTGTPSVDTSLAGDTEDLQKALEKMNNAILEAQIKLAQDMEDAVIDLGRKLVDIDTEYARKRAEAWIDYTSKVNDINADYQNTIADINAEAQQSQAEANADQLEMEAEFQNDMQELKENFLMDLEDALHARDARQVLKLIKQYNLDKLQAEREHKLDMDSAKQDEALRQQKYDADRQAAQRDRIARLAEAEVAYQEKLAQLARDEEAERLAAQLAYERKKEDLARATQDRLEIIGAGLISEYNLTQKGLEAILKLYSQYYTNIAQMANALNTMLAGQANLIASAPTYSTDGNNPNIVGSGIKYAEGGSVIANRPTKAIFGEAGLEMATFTPLGRKGQDVNKLFSNMSGGASGKGGGTLGLEILLSPDLEARVVENALNQTADIVTTIRRSK